MAVSLTKPATVRDLVAAIQRDVRETEDLTPQQAAHHLAHLTALLGNCAVEIREADLEYARVLLRCLESSEAANRAKIRAEITPEYQRKREARDTKELVIELIRSLKVILRAQEEEMRLAGRP